jgi:2-polyprenyl-6-methoxyphenol hydroxylase-like FAD-dependent oxidoreductase
VPDQDAAGWLSLTDEDFAAEAQAAMGGFLGKIAMLAPRSSYPLGFHHAAQITAKRLALAGDAAHAIHPIAGQGLNLGFRDVAALAQVLVEGARLGLDLGDRQLLDRYQRWRSLDAVGRHRHGQPPRITACRAKLLLPSDVSEWDWSRHFADQRRLMSEPAARAVSFLLLGDFRSNY